MSLSEHLEKLTFWKCPRCGRIHISLKKQEKVYCIWCSKQKLDVCPIFLAQKK